MSKVVYLAHYDLPGGQRCTSPAGTTVIRYIINSLENIKKQAILISPAQSTKKLPREEIQNGEFTKIVLLPTAEKPNKYNLVARYLKRRHQRKALENELLSQLEDGDTLMVYHSLYLIKTVRKIIKKRKITLLLQVCEIYGDVINSERTKNRELEFFKIADRYIFQSEMLEKLINTDGKPCAVLYGTYEVSENASTKNAEKDIAPKIRCVYAGTLDPRKGGAATAATVAEHLPENYHIHILGFGLEKEVREMRDKVAEISAKSRCSVSYDGCLSGREYIDFISSCHIGLSTQDPSASFNATSFPSKILAYMANGLRVVTVRIPAVEGSAIGHCMYYYDQQTPENIASAIMNVDIHDNYDGKNTIRRLNEFFLTSLRELI